MFREGNYLLNFRQLLNLFVVDMYLKVESERMLYLQLNQEKLRSEEYVHLRDALLYDGHVENMGKKVILPSSYTGENIILQKDVNTRIFKNNFKFFIRES